MSKPRPFNFDTVFDDAGLITAQAARPKRNYTPDETEAIRVQAYREGEASAVARAAEAQAQTLAQIAELARQAMGALARVAHSHREGSAELALACARAIADAALERFPTAPIEAALDVLAAEVEAAPRLLVRTSSSDPEIAQKLEALAHERGLPGQVVVKTEPGPPSAAFVLEWGDGKAAFDPAVAARRVAEALAEALEAEGLHAEPLLPEEAAHGH
jgi:flagellar assembly protein FliH